MTIGSQCGYRARFRRHARDECSSKEIGGGLLQHTPRAPRRMARNNIAIVFRGGQNDDARGSVSKLTFLEKAKPSLSGMRRSRRRISA